MCGNYESRWATHVRPPAHRGACACACACTWCMYMCMCVRACVHACAALCFLARRRQGREKKGTAKTRPTWKGQQRCDLHGRDESGGHAEGRRLAVVVYIKQDNFNCFHHSGFIIGNTLQMPIPRPHARAKKKWHSKVKRATHHQRAPPIVGC